MTFFVKMPSVIALNLYHLKRSTTYYMRLKKFIARLMHRKTGAYILLGVIIMFLTFFTSDNALEIAISGIASIFIGIGVNNFTQLETHQKDMAVQIKEIAIAVKTLQHAKNKVANTIVLVEENVSATALKTQLRELEDFIELSIEQLAKDIGEA